MNTLILRSISIVLITCLIGEAAPPSHFHSVHKSQFVDMTDQALLLPQSTAHRHLLSMKPARFVSLMDETLRSMNKRPSGRSLDYKGLYSNARRLYKDVTILIKLVNPDANLDEENYWGTVLQQLFLLIEKQPDRVALGFVWNRGVYHILVALLQQHITFDRDEQAQVIRTILDEEVGALRRSPLYDSMDPDSPSDRLALRSELSAQNPARWQRFEAVIRVAFPEQTDMDRVPTRETNPGLSALEQEQLLRARSSAVQHALSKIGSKQRIALEDFMNSDDVPISGPVANALRFLRHPARSATLRLFMPRHGRGGAATVADNLAEDQLEAIHQLTIRHQGESKEVNVRAFEYSERRLARRVKDINVYVVPGLARFDDVLIAHAGSGGEVFDASDPRAKHKRGVYFSPQRFAILPLLSAEAQIEFWRHELCHLDHPDWPEERVAAAFPLRQLRAEMAETLYYQTEASFEQAGRELDAVSRRLSGSRPHPISDRLKTIQNLLKTTSPADLFIEAKGLESSDPFWSAIVREAHNLFKQKTEKGDRLRSNVARRKERALYLLKELRALHPEMNMRSPVGTTLQEAVNILENAPVSARDAALKGTYGTDPLPETPAARVEDLPKRAIQAARPLERTDMTMVFVYRILESLWWETHQDHGHLRDNVHERALKQDPPDTDESRLPLFCGLAEDVDHAALRPTEDPILLEAHIVSGIAGSKEEALNALLKAAESRTEEGVIHLQSAPAFVDVAEHIFRRRPSKLRMHHRVPPKAEVGANVRKLREHEKMKMVMYLVGRHDMDGMEPEVKKKRSDKSPQRMEAEMWRMAYDVLTRADFIRFVEDRNPRWQGAIDLNKVTRDELLDLLERRHHLNLRDRARARKIPNVSSRQTETPASRALDVYGDIARPETRDRLRNLQERYRSNLRANLPLLESLEHVTGETEEGVVDHLLPHIGQHIRKGFYAVNVIRGILAAYSDKITQAAIALYEDGSNKLRRVHLFFGLHGTIVIEEVSGGFAIHEGSPEVSPDEKIVIKHPNVVSMADYLDARRFPGTPVLRQKRVRVGHRSRVSA